MAAGFAELSHVSMSNAVWALVRKLGNVPLDDGNGGRQYGREFLEQVGAVARLLELLDHADDDLIIDALRVDLCLPGLAAWRRWRGVGHSPCAFRPLFVEAQCGGARW